MLKAIDYEILRGVTSSGRVRIPVERKPVRVATLLNEDAFNQDHFLIHHKTVFLEEKMHDWDWSGGQFRYYARVAEVADVLVIYKTEEISFDPMTGKALSQ